MNATHGTSRWSLEVSKQKPSYASSQFREGTLTATPEVKRLSDLWSSEIFRAVKLCADQAEIFQYL